MQIPEIISAASAVEKLGIVGLLALLNLLLGYAAYYFRKELMDTHMKLSRMREAYLIVKIAADTSGASYSLDHIDGIDKIVRQP